ncbi:UNVERIFIED_CONTAM: hypothetical protein Slati_1387500 [Sesamum latifolium]|uniref:Uncharacterized protein n=1 Tax=Sesamum latifolium TaxID=2727402 RepID=A0AAW2X407_9LAMI
MTRELREYDPKHALRVQGSRPVAVDSSTACTRPSPDSGEKATIESQGVQTSDDSSQPGTSGVKEEEISLRPMTGTSKANTNELISLSSAWQGRDLTQRFILSNYRDPKWWPSTKSKPPSKEAPLVSAISEDDISTRRVWGLWVCLTEMDKVKYPFEIFLNKLNGSFLLNSMTGKSIEFAESMFEKKRMLIWENKLPATEATRMKTCNMLHVGQWHNCDVRRILYIIGGLISDY